MLEIGNLSTPEGRWAGLGPYYAMFPMSFAIDTVKKYTYPGDLVLDPFAGRGTSIFAAASQQRAGSGVEIHPVGWLYGHVKLNPADMESVEARIKEIGSASNNILIKGGKSLPDFFHWCFSEKVLSFLLSARGMLHWKTNKVDATVMALVLVYLHGKRGQALSNQMRQTKSMSPEYSIRWWKQREMQAPDIDPVPFLIQRVKWRYAKGRTSFTESNILLGDSTKLLPDFSSESKLYSLLLTSPPYYGVTNYHYDQWLRLWMLGEAPAPSAKPEAWRKKFACKMKYQELLNTVFNDCAAVMRRGSVIYVRTDAREFTLETTINALKISFPRKKLRRIQRPIKRATQTALYGDKSNKPGEIDLILT